MFSNIGKYAPCGIFTKGHFALIGITVLSIAIALKHSIKKSKEEIYEIIKVMTIVVCILEVIKIIYSISINSLREVNSYLPLYYCSMLIYAGLLSSFGKGNFKRAGDVFLMTGASIGGIVFIIYPSTSLPTYPAFHILSLHSFLYHGIMIYLGILVNKVRYIELEKEDIKYFASLVGMLCIIALIINNIFGSNLMFISENPHILPIELLYKLTNGTFCFSLIIALAQMTIPFYISYYIIKKIDSVKEENSILETEKVRI